METYSFNIVPSECTSGFDETLEQYADAPLVDFSVTNDPL